MFPGLVSCDSSGRSKHGRRQLRSGVTRARLSLIATGGILLWAAAVAAAPRLGAGDRGGRHCVLGATLPYGPDEDAAA